MKPPADAIERALAAPGRREMADALRGLGHALSAPDVLRLTRRLRELDQPRAPLRLAVLRTYTTELLRPWWTFTALLNGFDLDLHEGAYGALLQEVQPGSKLVAHGPEVTYLFLRWADVDPRFGRPLMGGSPDDRRALVDESVAQLHGQLATLRAALPGLLVVTMLPAFHGPELGLHDPMVPESEGAVRAALARALATRLRESLPATYLDDLDAVLADVGRRALFDRRLWETARFPFAVAGAQAVVRRLFTYALLQRRPKAKCIVVDADNTLWGGIVGEDGFDGIGLGPTYPGSAYVAFQRRLLELRQRGFLLALCSKNNEAEVRRVLTDHPHQLIRPQHLAATRVNWEPKAQNVAAVAETLNLGLDALVFVDDSAHECLAVRQALPQVLVVQTPAEPSDLPYALDDVPELEILGLTDEDRSRTALYAQEERRRALAAGAGDLDRYLESLDMTMTVGVDDPRAVARVAQLTQKTNQFNLTTRRYTEADVHRFVADPDWLVAHCSLADVFGDSGIVGVALVRGARDATAEIDTFLLSCRVIGRRAETAFLGHVLGTLAARGVRTVRAAFVPTERNELVRELWPAHGFAPVGADAYTLDLRQWKHADVPIRVHEASSPVRPPDDVAEGRHA